MPHENGAEKERVLPLGFASEEHIGAGSKGSNADLYLLT